MPARDILLEHIQFCTENDFELSEENKHELESLALYELEWWINDESNE